jgi:hypothetical protein
VKIPAGVKIFVVTVIFTPFEGGSESWVVFVEIVSPVAAGFIVDRVTQFTPPHEKPLSSIMVTLEFACPAVPWVKLRTSGFGLSLMNGVNGVAELV